jgi:GNAT superfamily N-acetyltransferase
MLNSAFQFEWLSSETIEPFKLLAPTGLDQALALRGPLNRWQAPGCHALGVQLLGIPVGLLLLQTRGSIWKRTAEAISLAIAEPFRRRGLATRMIENVVQSCKAAGIRCLSLSYPLAHPFEQAMARLCRPENGWQHAGGTLLYRCRTAEVPAFLESLRPFSRRLWDRHALSCVPYVEISPLQLLKAQLRLRPPGWAIPQMPQRRDSGWGALDPERSQALMQGADLVGWCLCHRISSATHRISIAYVAESLQAQGCLIIPVMQTVDAIARLSPGLPSGQDHAICFGVRVENQPMIRFSERRIRPFSRSTTQTVEMARFT